jgi:beta-xylosidase
MEQYITKHISQAEEDGTIFKINWDLAQFPEFSENPKIDSILQEKKRKMIEAISQKSKKKKEGFIGKSLELEKQYLRLTSV